MTERLTDPLDRLEASITDLSLMLRPANSNNLNTIRVEGAGSIWNGIAIGVALGAVIAGSVALAAAVQQMNYRVQQAEAFQAALYMTSPRLAEEIDKELDRKSTREKE